MSERQRAYRAPCPGCGAPVEFRSAQSTHAVCSYCQSTVVRAGETLTRIGKMAEVFVDHSPLQLMAAGRFEGRAFTLVGRLQYRGGGGPWTEWEAYFDDDGSTGQLAEDNGAYVFSFPADLLREVPAAAQFRLGAGTAIDGTRFTVTANEEAMLVAAQGELPKLPPLGQPFAVVELRSAEGEVISVEYGSTPPQVTRGKAVRLDDLALTGLRNDTAKEEKGARQFNCPNCGAAVAVALESTQSITCRSCNSLIDVSQGVGGELRHAMQDEPVKPLIPLGSIGQLQGAQWQVVGFQHRMGHEPGDEDESFGWSEYLLYNRKRGFIFLVDTEEGWSIVKPATGAPQGKADSAVTYLGTRYQLKYSYQAETTYVAGEFYWPVQRGQTSFNKDYAAGRQLLSMEQTPREQSWSVGNMVESDTIVAAFKLDGKNALFQRGDAGPTGGGANAKGCGCAILIIIAVVIFVIVLAALLADDDDRSSGSGYRSSGGSYGGYSSGGGHK